MPAKILDGKRIADDLLLTLKAQVDALDRGGADVIEIGVPFSDPVADGPVVEIAALDWNREIIKNIKAQDDEYLLQTLTGKDGELCPVHNKKPSIFPIPGGDDDDDDGDDAASGQAGDLGGGGHRHLS